MYTCNTSVIIMRCTCGGGGGVEVPTLGTYIAIAIIMPITYKKASL